jgi:hypothetical protein
MALYKADYIYTMERTNLKWNKTRVTPPSIAVRKYPHFSAKREKRPPLEPPLAGKLAYCAPELIGTVYWTSRRQGLALYITAWMHGTACAPGYPSDSTRSLAGVGSQDGLWAAAGTLITLAASGRLGSSTFTTSPLSGRAGAGATSICVQRPSSATPLPPTPPPVPHTCGQGWCRRSDDDQRHQPRLQLSPPPPTAPHAAGDGAAWRASISCMWGSYPIYLFSLSSRRRAVPTSHWSWAVCLAALGVPDRQSVLPLTTCGTLSGAGRGRRCRWQISASAVYSSGPGAGVLGPLVLCPLGWYCGAGMPAARGCDGRGDTGPGAAIQLPAASQWGRLRPAITCSSSSRAPGPFKLGRSYGRVGACAWRPRMPTSLCGPVAC